MRPPRAEPSAKTETEAGLPLEVERLPRSLRVQHVCLYNVHLNPSVFPMDRVWLTGRIPIERLRAEHPLEYQRWMARKAATGDAEGEAG